MSENIKVFFETLTVMGYGMAGIFTVMAIIFISIKGLNSVFRERK
ncbi:Na+-transporting methylmalonyl-CoA/oxaloacetate decarboxylase gamma subunit [Clostridium punense]|uniref:Na+-transporting methylmalonyl-CoA/oxaloacetate decarboxylase gamma subunit n=1 Tax=Clostridium punense TaxID=1054297 RepID=A0ABS4JYI8_9CLOT|nr:MULTISPECIES: OadG-related small transporter subunit [Clostridium]EQB87953.1 hypothetical protein M918_06495 [Clostridium sp. BL8]MBP2020602.1 Na+-transporting methylmalonyl-CoA/oxaloacetate decarboxylase gamma subunit [Clostridium punense]